MTPDRQYTFVTLKPLASTLHIVSPARATHTICGKAKPLVPPVAIRITRAQADTLLGRNCKVCGSCDRMRDAETRQGGAA
jgi:RNase P subunit RPR2